MKREHPKKEEHIYNIIKAIVMPVSTAQKSNKYVS